MKSEQNQRRNQGNKVQDQDIPSPVSCLWSARRFPYVGGRNVCCPCSEIYVSLRRGANWEKGANYIGMSGNIVDTVSTYQK